MAHRPKVPNPMPLSQRRYPRPVGASGMPRTCPWSAAERRARIATDTHLLENAEGALTMALSAPQKGSTSLLFL